MKCAQFMAVATILLTAFVVGAAQTSDKCQIVSVEVAEKEVDVGPPIVFNARLNAAVPTAKPEFKWQLNVGTIMAGEGTSSITVSTDGIAGLLMEATVSVSGISTICSTSATQSVMIRPQGPTCGMPFDQYGDIRFEDEQARLDNFAIQLTNFEAAAGQIIAYAGKQTFKDEAAERLRRAKNYLVEVRGLDPARIITVDGGYQDEFNVLLIIVPPGAKAPVVRPTLARDEVEFTKPHPRDRRKKKTSKRE